MSFHSIIGINKVPYLIAEISANHNGNFQLAKKLIKCAKDNGADAVKLQTYTADTMTIKSNKKDFLMKDGLWKGYNLWNLYNKACTPKQWHKDLFNYAKKINIKIFSTPFDTDAVDFLETLNCPIYKVASFEITHLPLIKRIAKTKKPIIISTGMSNLEEIELAFKTAKKFGAKNISLLYCVSNYPSKTEDFNINNIKILKEKFNCQIGFSDHSNDPEIAKAAVIAGAEIFEKHIGLNNQKKGFDIKFSARGSEIKKYKDILDKSYKMLGKEYFYRDINEKKNQRFRRSIFAARDIKKGEKFSKKNIKILRPNIGLSPIFYFKILNKKSNKHFKKNDPIKLNIKKN